MKILTGLFERYAGSSVEQGCWIGYVTGMLDWGYEREAELTVCQGCSFKKCVTGMVMELFDRHAELSV